MLNLFRVSPALLEALEKVYETNERKWIFFEALIPSTIYHYNLTMETWTASQSSYYNFRYRPCHNEFPAGGLYHPVKFHNGSIVTC